MTTTKKSKITTMQQITLALATITIGLTAGLFYAYSCSVNIGLGKLSDEGYFKAMQSINREILNTAFFVTFMGALFVLPLSSWFEYKNGCSTTFFLLLGATLLYAVGGFGVTMLGNVPLNDALDKFDMHSATVEQIARARSAFEVPWNKLHSIRTWATIASFLLTIIACLKQRLL